MVCGRVKAKMSIFLFLLCVLWVSSVRSLFDGTCPRKDLPPGVVVLSLGDRLDLTCSGHVKVNGVKVKNDSNSNKRRILVGVPSTPKVASNSAFSTKSVQNTVSEEYRSTSTDIGVSTMSEENKNLSITDTEYTTSPYMIQSTTTSRTPERVDEEKDTEDDYDHEEGLEGNRVTRDIKSRPQWKWNKELVGTGNRDWGKITFTSGGAALSLASVRLTDTGKYTCHQSGRETFAVKVIVADPPETPRLSCYKKSPSSKIRCEWTPQKPMIKQPHCYLLLSTNLPLLSIPKFHHIPCSYSSNLSRCWCALDNNDDEMRTIHAAFLCVTSIIGNATSPLIYFTPLSILKPDAPSNVSVQLEQEQKLRVTWNLPKSWKPQDSFYSITYELKYRPSKSSNEQVHVIKGWRSYTITDALPGVDYLIQLRSKEEYDGQWSDWSSPVYARIYVAEYDVLTTTTIDFNLEEIGSGFSPTNYPDDPTTNPVSLNSSYEPPYILWIVVVVVVAISSVIWAVYIFRHKSKFMSKLQSLSVITPHRDLSPPPPRALEPPEGEALITFVPQLYKDNLPNETQEGDENEEGQTATDRIEAMHFNNNSYFFLEREL
ncbi:interleukin-6 receptor subunit alpha [Melanotaenia boesemani]|uniref:interleukin-6 receptor subunit alpha n=1 Tax=Melanotaenia boesemani TaxID=1250792 RepID=UPI001C0488AD|nr:interleukin-6 receptor subunit alpha [Melanotaenia boesemani]